MKKKDIRKEIIKANELDIIKKGFSKVSNTEFSGFKASIETKICVMKLLEKIIEKKKSILEIGAGYGDFSLVFLKFFKKKIKKYTITELHRDLVNLIKKNLRKYKDVKIKQLDILYTKKFNEKYDIIIFSEVLEHLTTIEKELAFVNMNKLLNKGGYLIISCPITEYLGKRVFYSRVKGIKKRAKLEYRTIRSHIDVPSITKMIGLFYRKGFDNVKIKPLPIILPFKKKKKIELLIKVLEFFSIILPSWFRVYLSPGVVVIGKKVSSLDDTWYNNTDYLMRYIPSEKVSEGKMYETFIDYKCVGGK